LALQTKLEEDKSVDDRDFAVVRDVPHPIEGGRSHGNPFGPLWRGGNPGYQGRRDAMPFGNPEMRSAKSLPGLGASKFTARQGLPSTQLNQFQRQVVVKDLGRIFTTVSY
jgi:hypothetical protein